MQRIGIYVLRSLRELGQLDLIVSLLYVVFLGTVGGLMLYESLQAMRRTRGGQLSTLKKPGQHNWVHRLPFKMRFRASKIYVSIIPVFGLGGAIGFLSSIMGVGGGFIMVPAMIYLLKVPTNVVIGTSLYQIVFVTAFTDCHAGNDQSISRYCTGTSLMTGGVIGAQYGAASARNCAANNCARCWPCWFWPLACALPSNSS